MLVREVDAAAGFFDDLESKYFARKEAIVYTDDDAPFRRVVPVMKCGDAAGDDQQQHEEDERRRGSDAAQGEAFRA